MEKATGTAAEGLAHIMDRARHTFGVDVPGTVGENKANLERIYGAMAAGGEAVSKYKGVHEGIGRVKAAVDVLREGADRARNRWNNRGAETEERGTWRDRMGRTMERVNQVYQGYRAVGDVVDTAKNFDPEEFKRFVNDPAVFHNLTPEERASVARTGEALVHPDVVRTTREQGGTSAALSTAKALAPEVASTAVDVAGPGLITLAVRKGLPLAAKKFMRKAIPWVTGVAKAPFAPVYAASSIAKDTVGNFIYPEWAARDAANMRRETPRTLDTESALGTIGAGMDLASRATAPFLRPTTWSQAYKDNNTWVEDVGKDAARFGDHIVSNIAGGRRSPFRGAYDYASGYLEDKGALPAYRAIATSFNPLTAPSRLGDFLLTPGARERQSSQSIEAQNALMALPGISASIMGDAAKAVFNPYRLHAGGIGHGRSFSKDPRVMAEAERMFNENREQAERHAPMPLYPWRNN